MTETPALAPEIKHAWGPEHLRAVLVDKAACPEADAELLRLWLEAITPAYVVGVDDTQGEVDCRLVLRRLKWSGSCVRYRLHEDY